MLVHSAERAFDARPCLMFGGNNYAITRPQLAKALRGVATVRTPFAHNVLQPAFDRLNSIYTYHQISGYRAHEYFQLPSAAETPSMRIIMGYGEETGIYAVISGAKSFYDPPDLSLIFGEAKKSGVPLAENTIIMVIYQIFHTGHGGHPPGIGFRTLGGFNLPGSTL